MTESIQNMKRTWRSAIRYFQQNSANLSQVFLINSSIRKFKSKSTKSSGRW